MAPGPHVEILDDKPLSFESASDSSVNDVDDDEDSIGYKYYRSKKILGKLFDAVNESEMFQTLQKHRVEKSPNNKNPEWDPAKSLLAAVWEHIQAACADIEWKLHLDRARGIRDEEVLSFYPAPPPSSTEIYYPDDVRILLTSNRLQIRRLYSQHNVRIRSPPYSATL
jgi:hypothetical protein